MEFEGAFFDTSEFELTDKVLGEGTFGKVYVVTKIEDESEYAAKIISTRGIFSGRDQMLLLRESSILHKLDHPGIVKFYGINFHSFSDPSLLEPTILTEYLSNGSLKIILDKEKNNIADHNWSPTKKYICLLGISSAMQHLHEEGILHRDLKPQNILVDSNYYPRVCDFGLSRRFSDTLNHSMQISMTGHVGTPLYMAPELLEDDTHYGPGVDVYAFGMIAYEIMCGKEPFCEKGHRATMKTILNNVMNGNRPELDESVSEKMKELISRCWSQESKDRPSFKEIFEELSNDFSHSSEDIDEDEVNEYILNLEEWKKERDNQRKKENKSVQSNKVNELEEELKKCRIEMNKKEIENKKLQDEIDELKRHQNLHKS